MAKKDKLENPIDEQEVDLTESSQQEEEAVVVTKEKEVRVHVIEDVDCYIAKVHYTLTKGKDVKVPKDVAAILTGSNKVFRL